MMTSLPFFQIYLLFRIGKNSTSTIENLFSESESLPSGFAKVAGLHQNKNSLYQNLYRLKQRGFIAKTNEQEYRLTDKGKAIMGAIHESLNRSPSQTQKKNGGDKKK